MMRHEALTRLADAEAEQAALLQENADLRRRLYATKFIDNPICDHKVLDSIGE